MVQKVFVTSAATDAWLAKHAADELARYVAQITGAGVRVVDETPSLEPNEVAFILSVGEGADRLKGLPGAKDPERLRDGFLIQSQGERRVLIAATEAIGLLYGVYDYLEKCCGVGFFWDGDRVPRHSNLPVTGIDVAVLPRWPVRHFGLSNCWGLAKWHNHFRTLQERKRIFDWMAKRKINRSHYDFSPTIARSGLSAVRVFGLSDKEPDNFTFAGWPGCLDWPAAVRTRLLQEQFEHSRRRGITWVYYLAYGNLPHQFRQTHPQYKYVEHLGYSATVLYPDDPEAARWSKTFYKDLIETYGTDHLYQDTPFVESSGSGDLDKSFELKLTAARQMCRVFRELDEKAVWQSDSWDFQAIPALWTPERIKRYFAALPREMMLVYDTAGLGNPYYKRTDYFAGTRWLFGILHSFQGDDHLHGNLNHALGALQSLSTDPQADKCLGVYHVPETSGHNVLFFDLTTHLAWNPDGMTLSGYLDEYTLRRFGTSDYARMRPAVDALARGVYGAGGGHDGQMPIYQKLGCHYGPAGWWPIVDEKRAPHAADDGTGILELQEAIRTALACRRTQRDNDLYVNDMVDWTRQYLATIFNWAVIDAFRALGKGNAKRVTSRATLARECLKHIDAILSTRPDFSLKAQIDQAMQVPGANPHLPWYMKQHCINDLYSANEVYEQLHWYYAPRMEVYFAELEKRAAVGVKTIAWADIADRCNAIQKRWLDEDIAVPDKEKSPGTAMEAVVAAFETIDPTKESPLLRFRLEVEAYTGSGPIESLREIYRHLMDDADLAAHHAALTLQMARAEYAAGHRELASVLVRPFTEPFMERALAPDLRRVLGEPANKPAKVRPLLVAAADGSVKRVRKDGQWCIVTQRERGKPYVYFALPEGAGLRNQDRTVRLTISYYSDGGQGSLFRVQYDSHYSNDLQGAYRDSEGIAQTKKPGWHTVVVECPRARFAGNQNERSDFRIAVLGDADLFLRRIDLEPAQ